MSTSAIAGYAGYLQRAGSVDPDETMATVARLAAMELPEFVRDVLDGTEFGSKWREKIAGQIDPGEVNLTLHFDPTAESFAALFGADFNSASPGNLRRYRIVFSNAAATTWQFAARVTRYAPKMPMEGKLVLEVTLTLSGEPESPTA